MSADLHILALFDLDAGTYDTGSRFDLPPGREFNLDRINVTRGRLEVSYTSRQRVSRMRARTDGSPTATDINGRKSPSTTAGSSASGGSFSGARTTGR